MRSACRCSRQRSGGGDRKDGLRWVFSETLPISGRFRDGVINAATSDVTNALAEGLKSQIQWIKRKACGYRNRERFRTAIYFHLGGVARYPETLKSTHSKA